MFADYISLVFADYHKKKAKNVIAPRLINPTSAKLKEECMAVCKERFLRTDYKTLRTFFGQAADQKSFLQIMEGYDTDKFKPLVNFLKKKTNDTEDKNIELLAWLIDFTPRPYELGRRYNEADAGSAGFEKERQNEKEKEERIDDAIDKEERTIKNEQDRGKGETPLVKSDYSNAERTKDAAPIPATQTTTFKIIGATLALAILAFVIMSIFWPKPNKPQVFPLTGHESCMFWTGDHFQQVSCNQKLGDTLVIALDSVKLNHFKKITQPDTITRKAIGNVWYVKVNGNIEFYTADGYHPVHPELRLHPISLYIINKYIKSSGLTE